MRFRVLRSSIQMANSRLDKLGRNYRLEVSTVNSTIDPLTGQVVPQKSEILTFTIPLTVSFDITRNYLKSANHCSIRIYNLSEKTRNLIRKDFTDFDLRRTVKLYGGYGGAASYNNLSLCFFGQISQCWSVREGVDFITEIECMDAGFAFQKAEFNEPITKGVSKKALITAMINSMSDKAVTLGKIGTFPDSQQTGNTYYGSTIGQLNDLAKDCFFIDNGIANCLNSNETFNGAIGVINSQSGLLNTPQKQNTLIYFDMLFEPRLVAGQYILLHSSTEANYNGAYKVMSLHHRGMISASVCGDAVTTVGLQASPYGYNFTIL